MTDTVEYTYGNAYWSDRLTAINVNGTSKNISYATYLNPSSWYNGTQFTNLTWTQGRRLSSITKGSQTYSYEYDMAGARTSKVANGLRHEYVTQNGRIVREIVTNASTGAFQYALDFTYDEAGHPLTMRKYNNANMQNNYITMQYVCNAQGDVLKLIYNGTVYAEYTYDAWGNVLTATENGSYNYAALNPLRYRGYYYDTETGFYYLQSRYYDPIVKRFLNADSYSYTGQGFLGYNMFAYCIGNPVSCADYNGEDACLVIDHEGANGYGHINLFVQDVDGNWHYYSFASDESKAKTVIWNVFFDYPVIGKVTKADLGCADGYDLSSFDGFKDFISSTGKVDKTAEAMDTAIYLKGDYTKTQALCAQDEYFNYHVYGFNCLHYALSRLNHSKQIKGLKQLMLLYAYLEFYSPNDAEPYLCYVGEQLK